MTGPSARDLGWWLLRVVECAGAMLHGHSRAFELYVERLVGTGSGSILPQSYSVERGLPWIGRLNWKVKKSAEPGFEPGSSLWE